MAARNVRLLKGVLGVLPLLAVASAGVLESQPLLPSGREIPVSLSGGRFEGPRVAVLPNGGFVAAWTVADRRTPHSRTLIRARFFARDGTARSGEIDLHEPANPDLGTLAVAADLGFWMTWDQEDLGRRLSAVARRYDRRGRPLTPPFVVHAPSPLDRADARLAVAPDGGVVIAWAAEGLDFSTSESFDDTVVRFFAPDGTPRSPELNLGHGDQGDSHPAGIGVAADGSAWILQEIWADGRADLKLQHLAADGTIGPSLAVCQGSVVCTPADSGVPFVEQGALAMRRDGSFVALWAYTENEIPPAPFRSVIQGRLFAGDGTPLGDAFQVNADRDGEVDPVVATLPDGRFIALWKHLIDDEIYGRSFAADGTPASGDFRLRDGDPGGLAAGDGGAVAIFLSPRGTIVARRFVAP
ncbi:MAG TPA: hypothetical protein VHB47_19730 [Thermoanaerobaculia bacterium]|jgi:hypothetical protein|nr:hypothetical protein [Thermoanaerobaculia bacterium]